MNRKLVPRLVRAHGWLVQRKQRKRMAAVPRVPQPTMPNEAWAMDFVFDGTAGGRIFRTLNVINRCARECLGIVDSTGRFGLMDALVGAYVAVSTFAIAHPILSGVTGLVFSVLLPEEAYDSMIASGVLLLDEVGRLGKRGGLSSSASKKLCLPPIRSSERGAGRTPLACCGRRIRGLGEQESIPRSGAKSIEGHRTF